MTGQRVGIVTNYDPRLHRAAVRLEDVLRLGDRVSIRGTNGGITLPVKHIECEDCERRVVEGGQEVTIEVPDHVEAGSIVEMELEAPWS
jgi:hypothetical protein